MDRVSLSAALLAFAWAASASAASCDFGVRIEDREGRQGALVQVGVELDFDAARDGGGGVQGWSYGVCHDPAVVTVIAAVPADPLLRIKHGAPPSFSIINVEPDDPTPGVPNGVTHGVLLDFDAVFTIHPPVNGLADLKITYRLDAGPDCPADPREPGPPCLETALRPCDELGSPKIVSVMVVGGRSSPLCPEASRVGTIRICCPPPQRAFIRGDANIDRRVDIADGIAILNWLFQRGDEPRCLDAADVNDDGGVDASDAIYTFRWQFLDGPAPASPWPDCGLDPAAPADDLTCEEYPCP